MGRSKHKKHESLLSNNTVVRIGFICWELGSSLDSNDTVHAMNFHVMLITHFLQLVPWTSTRT